VATHRFVGSTPTASGRRWTLHIVECTDGRLAVDGLPEDRDERLSLTVRLHELLRAISHADDIDGLGDGVLWQRYARVAFAAWAEEVTVQLVAAERDLGTPPGEPTRPPS
jgi:hypothetical protein